jgi:hypothetical protein
VHLHLRQVVLTDLDREKPTWVGVRSGLLLLRQVTAWVAAARNGHPRASAFGICSTNKLGISLPGAGTGPWF